MPLNSTSRLGRSLAVIILGCLSAACGSSPKGDPIRGQELYAQCAGCHQMQTNTVGPMHCGLIGRAAASVPEFPYSEAMRSSGIVWNVEELDAFLTSPLSYVSGTGMGFPGLSSAAERADVIAYLQQANADPAVCPPSHG